MKRETLALIISVMLIVAHVAGLVFSFVWVGMELNKMDVAADMCAILAPMTGAYILLIVQSAADKLFATPSEEVVNNTSAWLFISFTLLFVLGLAFSLGLALNRAYDPPVIKTAIALVETAFGAHLAIFVKKLFAS